MFPPEGVSPAPWKTVSQSFEDLGNSWQEEKEEKKIRVIRHYLVGLIMHCCFEMHGGNDSCGTGSAWVHLLPVELFSYARSCNMREREATSRKAKQSLEGLIGISSKTISCKILSLF